ncbi:MAG: AI-2E family transporter [Clostridia bacterium]|nr:AI-2E family transporter [Clostridia bacterium]
MQLRIAAPARGRLRVIGVISALTALAIVLFRPLVQVAALVLGAALLCFVASPLAKSYERRLSRPLSALLCLLSIGLVCVGIGWLLLPTMLRELIDLARALPGSVERLAAWTGQAQSWLSAHLPGVALPELNLSGMEGALSGAVTGVLSAVYNVADVIGQLSMVLVLAYFFLCDRENLLLRLELLLPQSVRHTAVCMASAAGRELRLYLRGQLMISGVVGLMSTLALLLTGVRGALALGPIVGLFNMIPYFGPFIGSIPAVLIALGDGWQRAAMAALALALVQQLDGAWISPRIMGSLTGFSPALVLVGIYAGARIGGIAGMLFALPIMMLIRTLFRIFVQKYENI